jgi:hypothetical protein
MKFLFILNPDRIQVAKYSEFWSLYVNWVHPHVLSLTTPTLSPHNHVQNKNVKILYHCRVLYLCTVQRVLKTPWDSRRLDWSRLGRCASPLTLESDWTGLGWTGLCWFLCTVTEPLLFVHSWGLAWVIELLLHVNDSGVCMKFRTPCPPSVRMSCTKGVYQTICLTGRCSGSTLQVVFGTYLVHISSRPFW